MTEPKHDNRLARAYGRMMERVKLLLEELDVSASIEHAAEKAVELDELTREEARLIGGYLKRDIEDASQYLTSTGRDLRAWMRFDLKLIEDRLLDYFQSGVDRSRLELLAFEVPAAGAETEVYRSGEVTGPGTLQCGECGKLVVSHAPAFIEPCPVCQGTIFVRATERFGPAHR
ncbi:MAG TPA: zinc ribbon-containing protein [Candidatus Competibacter sp.]|nr:zinc ribbon-containing protein [Candidatus Competibacter sp.]